MQTWIGNRIKGKIELEYQRKLEEIRSEYAKELATLNNTLHETREFKATRLRLVYDRKIAALCEGFGTLAKLEQCLGEYVTFWGKPRGPEREVTRKAFATTLQDFEGFFVRNRIFFPSGLAEEITQVKNAMHNTALEFMLMVESEDSIPSETHKAWVKTYEWTQQELPKIRRKIEEQIRIELGESTT